MGSHARHVQQILVGDSAHALATSPQNRWKPIRGSITCGPRPPPSPTPARSPVIRLKSSRSCSSTTTTVVPLKPPAHHAGKRRRERLLPDQCQQHCRGRVHQLQLADSLDGTIATSVQRTQGWHEFKIEVYPYTGNAGDVKFYIDGQSVANGKRYGNYDLDSIRLGISIKSPGSSFWYDNVDLGVVPEPASALLLGIGGLVALRRREDDIGAGIRGPLARAAGHVTHEAFVLLEKWTMHLNNEEVTMRKMTVAAVMMAMCAPVLAAPNLYDDFENGVGGDIVYAPWGNVSGNRPRRTASTI